MSNEYYFTEATIELYIVYERLNIYIYERRCFASMGFMCVFFFKEILYTYVCT